MAYSWAERGERLGEAREYVTRALKAEPDNGAYVDTLGWICLTHNLRQPHKNHPMQIVIKTWEISLVDGMDSARSLARISDIISLDKAARRWNRLPGTLRKAGSD